MSPAPSNIGQTLGHYHILEQIGAGGMGVVYRAHDERLDRNVALKVLPAGTLTDENARRRFRKEALTLSKLSHPNIATVHDFDTQDGMDFLVMEYVTGVTLEKKLASGSLPETEVVALGSQIAKALDDAHEHGIVHCDLKPGNVMVTPKGQVKLLDFGLAKLFRVKETAATESLTEIYGGGGTLPYMAPERLRGVPPDQRADIWAVGAVFYEMATGQRAFSENGPLLIDAILNKVPLVPSEINRRVSPGLENLVLKALEKDPEHRYQSAREMVVDLERLSASMPLVSTRRRRRISRAWRMAGTAGLLLLILIVASIYYGLERKRPIDSIAVLPFVNASSDESAEYLSDGVTESLIDRLSKLPRLKVMARSTVFRFKGGSVDPRSVGRDLNVRTVLTGRVSQRGDRLIVRAELVDVADGSQLWGEQYNQKVSDLLILQDEIPKRISEKLQLNLSGTEKRELTKHYTDNGEAYQLYLQGRYHVEKWTEEGTRLGREYFQQAIAKDPNYALAYAGLADSYVFGQVGLRPEEAVPRAKAAAMKALEIDSTLGEAHAALAQIKFTNDWDWAGAETEFKRAIELNPNDTEALHMYSHYLLAMGRSEESYVISRRALELDPVSPAMNLHLGFHYLMSRQYDAAIQQYLKTLQIDPNYTDAHNQLAEAYRKKGMFDQAVTEYLQAETLLGASQEQITALKTAYAKSGMRGYWLRVLEFVQEPSQQSNLSPYNIAVYYSILDKKSDSFEWLQKAYEEHDGGLVSVKVDSDFDNLRSDPRFADLLHRMGLPQ